MIPGISSFVMNYLRGVKNMRKAALAVVVLSVVTMSSCIGPYFDAFDFDYESFKTEEAAWYASGRGDYSYEYYSAGFTLEHVKVDVVGGEYASSAPIGSSAIGSYAKTIDDIYAEIEAAYVANKDAAKDVGEGYMTGIEVKYSADHVPVSVAYGYWFPPWIMVDGNFGFSILNFARN